MRGAGIINPQSLLASTAISSEVELLTQGGDFLLTQGGDNLIAQ